MFVIGVINYKLIGKPKLRSGSFDNTYYFTFRFHTFLTTLPAVFIINLLYENSNGQKLCYDQDVAGLF